MVLNKTSKCDQCENNNCEKCQDRKNCKCKCNSNKALDITQKTLAITGGLAAAIGGLSLTILSGGLAAPLVGGILIGAGVSSTIQGVEKAYKKQEINGLEFIADVGFGALTGVFTGGIGAAGEAVAATVIKQGAKETIKAAAKQLAVRGVAGGVAGVTSRTITEIKECTLNEKEWSDFGKKLDEKGNEKGTISSWVMSAGTGVIGGMRSNRNNNFNFFLI